MKPFLRLLAAIALGAPVAACAHTGHGAAGLLAGLTHPLGADHLLAMLAVGVWSVAALPARQRLVGPAVFMLALLAGAVCGTLGLAALGGEAALAASVVLLAALLLAPRALPLPAALALVAAAALLHGLAHGAELPAGAPFGAYAAGFLAATAALHAYGMGLGVLLARAHAWVWKAAAAALGAAGMALLAWA